MERENAGGERDGEKVDTKTVINCRRDTSHHDATRLGDNLLSLRDLIPLSQLLSLERCVTQRALQWRRKPRPPAVDCRPPVDSTVAAAVDAEGEGSDE